MPKDARMLPPLPVTKMAFRMWDGDGECTAIMPEVPSTADPYMCTCYVHMGGHGSCSPHVAATNSRPARPEEYADLKRELESRGYRVQVIQKINRQAYLNARRIELAAIQKRQRERTVKHA